MSSQNTEGIVLQKIDYSESSLVLKVLTPDQGIQSFIFQGAKRKNKKGNLISPMAILNIDYFQRNDSQLGKIRAVEPAIVFKTLSFDPYKSSVLFFMNEILLKTVKEKGADEELYTFVRSMVEILDLSDNISNFPIRFLYRLTKFLGFYPQLEIRNPNAPMFLDLQEGKYVSIMPSHPFFLSAQKSALLLQLADQRFDGKKDPIVSLEMRRELLKDLLKFYQIIIDNFGEVQSLSVLEATLHD